MPSRRTSFEYTRVIANAAHRLPDLRLALSAKSVPGACTLAATDRADAEVSAESRRATGSTNQRPRIRPTAAVTTLPLRSELIPEQKPAARTRSGDEAGAAHPPTGRCCSSLRRRFDLGSSREGVPFDDRSLDSAVSGRLRLLAPRRRLRAGATRECPAGEVESGACLLSVWSIVLAA